jgi:hypothetical protein
MNVLFYIDPHVIRQEPLGYWPIINRLYKNLFIHQSSRNELNEFDFKLLLTMNEAPLQPFIVTLPEKVRRELMKFNCKWDRAAIKQWEMLMRGEGMIAEIHYDILYYLMKHYSIDVFIYWGSNRTVRKFAESFKIYSFAMELGPTRQSSFLETIYFDPLGVNGDSYSTKLVLDDYSEVNIDSLCYSLEFQFDFFSSAYRPIHSKHSQLIYSQVPKVLLPLQLDDDSNCILYSDFDGMENFLKSIIPKLIDKYYVFVKPHPGAHPSRNMGGARKMNVEAHQRCEEYVKDIYSRCQRAIWLDDVVNKESYLSLLKKMDAVITVNSSVGFEAMLLGKVAITLGRASYNISNCLPTFEDLVNSKINMEEYRKVAGKIANLMLNYYLYPIEILDDLSVMTRALKRGIAITDQYRLGGYEAINRFVRDNPINFVSSPAKLY